MDETLKREAAWVGDAVLALFAREWILKQKDIPVDLRTQVFISMTSNEFLSSFGEPTAVEAKIGKIYREEGLDKAMQWIEEAFIPVHRKQQLNREKGNKGNKKKRNVWGG